MLSTTAEYALRIMIVLADSNGAPITSEKIAACTEVPSDYSVKVLQMLARADLVRAQRGRGGGFQIACDPSSTSLLDVVNAIDPIERINECPIGREDPRDDLCELHRRLDEVIRLVQQRLGSVPLSQFVGGENGPALCQPAAVRAAVPNLS